MNVSPARCFLALAVLLAVLAFPSLAADPPKCKLVRIAEWPVNLQRNLPVIEGAIDGKKLGILLDTGAYASLVTKDAAAKLGLLTKATADFVHGFRRESRIHIARLGEPRRRD